MESLISAGNTNKVASRVVNLTSIAHTFSYSEGLHGPDLVSSTKEENEKTRYNKWSNYGQSKLCNLLHAKEIQKRCEEKKVPVRAFSVHPGVILTPLYANVFSGGFIMRQMQGIFLKTVPQGAATTLYCSLAPELDTKSGGGYFFDCNEQTPKSYGDWDTLQGRLWDASVEITKSDFK